MNFKNAPPTVQYHKAWNPYGQRQRALNDPEIIFPGEPTGESAWRSQLEAGGDRSLMTPKTTRALKGSLRQAAGFGNEI